MTLYFITGNRNKFNEAKEVIPNLQMLDLDLPEIQGVDGEEIIKAKLAEAMKDLQVKEILLHSEVIVEDTGLHFDCINGLPGPLIKWFLKGLGPQGLYEITRRYGNHHAHVRCLLGYAREGNIEFFEGVVKGEIVPPTGDSAFGWDPVFRPTGHEKTYAQMNKEEKVAISHRSKALLELKRYLALMKRLS
jgi:non-canonical purine NTP pyrophosphatase (RdgB/HAM1 family)